MEFRKIDKSNYWDCMALTVAESQESFVADNKQSLVEAAYEEGLYTLGIYHGETMIGFVLYDYDDTFPGWSMSRFMIGVQFHGHIFIYSKSQAAGCSLALTTLQVPAHTGGLYVYQSLT